MGLLSLPPEAVLPLIIGLFTGIYGAVAALSILPMAPEHMILVAIFLLISHNLVQEGAVQGNSGINAIKVTLLRLVTSVVTVVISASFLNMPEATHTASTIAGNVHDPFVPLLKEWGIATAVLGVKILLIIVSVMTILQVMKACRIIPLILKPLSPFMRLMGLENKLGLLWLTATLFGLSYRFGCYCRRNQGV